MLEVGMLLGNRYEIIEKIGAGGMSIVYKAKCQKLNRFVAVKVLREEFNDDDTFVTKFRVEAQAAASLSHPHIINVFDVGSEKSTHYIVMEYVEGPTLKEYITQNGGLSSKETLEIGRQIASALRIAHTNKIVHRDIKPQNIIVSKGRNIKVTDFGIARATNSATITLSANAIGSVHYFSPEQARGGYVDEKSDLYSLGITMYEMVTNSLPFQADSPVSVALQHLKEEFPHPSKIKQDIWGGLEAIILKATKKKPEMRYQTADEFMDEIEKALHEPSSMQYTPQPDVSHIDNPTISLSGTQLQTIQEQSKEFDAPVKVTRSSDRPSVDDLFGKGPKEFDLEEDEERNKDRLVVVSAVATAAVIIAILIFFGYRMIFGSAGIAPISKTIEVPNVVSMATDEAKEKIEALGLVYEVEEEVYNNEYKEGTIFWQEKLDSYRKGDTIKVKVSKGIEKMIVENVTELNFIDARDRLSNQGFVVKTKTEFSDTVNKGQVFNQEPASGSNIEKGSEVWIYISKGKEVKYVTVPKLKGLTEQQARVKITEKGLEIGSVEYYEHDTIEEGKVISQSSEPGAEVREKYKINLAISKGKPVVEEPETGPTTDPTSQTGEDSTDSTSNTDQSNEEETDTTTTTPEKEKEPETFEGGKIVEYTSETILGDLESARVTIIQMGAKTGQTILYNKKGMTKADFPLKLKVESKGESKVTLRILINGITKAEDAITF